MRKPGTWWLFFLVTLVVALAYRVPQLGERPLHTDEAVQAVKFGQLLEEGYYRYNPSEYHGPTLYYLSLPATALTGTSSLADLDIATLRWVPLVFGLGSLLLLPLLRDALGRSGVVLAALLMALSSIQIYYNRYYIQESLLVFFSFGFIVFGWRYLKSFRWGWALAAGLCAGLMHATKETCLISFAAIGGALVVLAVLDRKRLRALVSGDSGFAWWHLALMLGSGILVSALFYSSFFAHPTGILDSYRSYFLFAERAEGQGHEKPWAYYLQLILGHRRGGFVWSETIILICATVGGLFSMPWKKTRETFPRLGFFFTVYVTLLFVAYSMISYKTPWLMMGFMQGMAVLGGYGLSRLAKRPAGFLLAAALLVYGVLELGGQSCRVAFRFAADERNPYAYSHTSPHCEALAQRVHDIAYLHPDKQRMPVKVISPEYWPLPWYLRDLERVGYWNEVPEDPVAPVIIASPNYEQDLSERLGDAYTEEFFGLRPGVMLSVFIEKDLWDAFIKTRL